MSSAGDRILEVLATRGQLNQLWFVRTIERLAPSFLRSTEDHGLLRYRLMRALASLGYCDLRHIGGTTLVSSPLALVRIPQSGRVRALVAGARTSSLVKKLENGLKTSKVSLTIAEVDSDLPLPKMILVNSETAAELRTFAQSVGLPMPSTPPAMSILRYAHGLDKILADAAWVSSSSMESHRAFDPETFVFRYGLKQTDGYRLIRYLAKTGTSHRLERKGMSCDIDRDWGRYAVLSESNIRPIIYYRLGFALSVPAGLPLPRIVERSLVLCSGLPPARHTVDGLKRYIYQDISYTCATEVALKLGQKLLIREERYPEEGPND